METNWTLWTFYAFDVKVVREVEGHREARFYRDDILTGHCIRSRLWVSWTGQMSLWLIKYTPTAGYWE